MISKTINKLNFTTIFIEAFNKITIDVIQNKFKECGFYLFDKNTVYYDKCIPNRSISISDVFTKSSVEFNCNISLRPTNDEFLTAKRVI